ncbi:MAG TPA: VOC family protein [Gemmatimonadaceae bacterium]|nr:VOC family protein [Gemmatimonadaceae bacterium]
MTSDSSMNSGNGAKAAEPLQGTALAASMTVNDLQQSLAWYQDVLGFSVDQKHERDGVLRAVSLKAGDVRIVIGQDDGAKGLNRVKGVAISLQITTTQNIDEIAERVKAAGGVLVADPSDTPWGARMFRITDPDGFLFVISSR